MAAARLREGESSAWITQQPPTALPPRPAGEIMRFSLLLIHNEWQMGSSIGAPNGSPGC